MPNDTTQQTTTSNPPPVFVDPGDMPPMLNENQVKQDISTPTSVKEDSGTAAPADDIVNTVMPAVVTTSGQKKKFAGGKVIATILGLFVLVGGLGAGIFLVQQQQLIGEKAAGNRLTYCQQIKAYSTNNWTLLTPSVLSSLNAGDSVNFCATGVASSGSFDKARFTINGTLRPDVTTIRPNSEDFCDLYVIPTGTTTFNVTAELHHRTLGWK